MAVRGPASHAAALIPPPPSQAAATLQQWAEAFEAERQGALRGAAGPITPAVVAQAAEAHLGSQLAALGAREAGLQATAAQTAAENLQLRRALHVARQAAEPSVVQLRQLLLDPAVNREFAGLRAELEARTRELAAAQLELKALKFGPEPLLAKLDRQQDEIANLRRQVGESRAQQLERTVAALREQLEEMQRVHAELEQHSFAVDQQAERLAEQLLLAKRGLGPRPQLPGSKPPPRRP
ncbi:hypothetical protein CHLNCDRAFT_140946 [Chlorella variabilis]|uniref:Uncharacterized protein n=1 Tax=Chlorella variabilis TaxID=554065 RepID=E1Z6K6_CHLVA|nr:hypothetical protein CHLNCDRAFT_140946 [Chlorella variabilis]EFN58948.1 hypothetical protein CHLNCDRAFT_140946 [Chlorella variabilis]|eukprot:XP_005851050.1 hypothetical protein CHLNCDRAFT_140946 [Chlorella variabilis]